MTLRTLRRGKGQRHAAAEEKSNLNFARFVMEETTEISGRLLSTEKAFCTNV